MLLAVSEPASPPIIAAAAIDLVLGRKILLG
jgi:hypothetical protein